MLILERLLLAQYLISSLEATPSHVSFGRLYQSDQLRFCTLSFLAILRLEVLYDLTFKDTVKTLT